MSYLRVYLTTIYMYILWVDEILCYSRTCCINADYEYYYMTYNY
jgi:hypothetical protein